MADFFEIVLIAFLAQLAVLPGEKVQFIIAGLATRYHPLGVVAAASVAFAGWTALEIAFGGLLTRLFPALVLDGLTAGLFLLFAWMLLRSAPAGGDDPAVGEDPTAAAETDGGFVDFAEDVRIPLLDREVPSWFGGYVPIFVMMAAGEFGDKTQLITIDLAVQFGATPAIWLGEMLAIVPVSLANAYFFDRFASHLNLRYAHFGAAALFAFFGLDTVLSMTVGFSVWETVVTGITNVVLAAA